MDLETKEAEVFWPLYREYRTEMLKVNDRFVTLLTSYLESYDNLTDQQANKLLDDYVSIEKGRTAVKASTCRVSEGAARTEGGTLLPDRP